MDNIKTDKYYLEQIIDCCDFIQENANKYTDDQICEDKILINSLYFYITNIGENANKISEDFKKIHSDIPWKKIISLRNVINHNYGDVGFQTIVDTIHRDIPKLQSWVDNLL